MLVSMFDSSGSFKRDSVKKKFINCLNRAYDNPSLSFYCCDKNSIQSYQTAKNLKESDMAFIWNGSEIGCFWFKELCQYFKIPYCIVERGLFPQAPDNFIIDSDGICCRSKSLNESSLVQGEVENNICQIKKYYLDRKIQRKKPKDKYVFVFQLDFDSTVYHYSNYTSNEQMVDDFVAKHKVSPDSVVVCPHPRNKNIKSKYKISDKQTIKECEDAVLAIGISSTTMYEIHGMGCPVKVLAGNQDLIHPINRQWSDKNLIIPCVLQNQFDIKDNSDIIKRKIDKNLKSV